MHPHEGVAETVDAAVAAVARTGVRADAGRLAGPPDVDRRRHACDEPVGEPGAAARVVAARQGVLEIGQCQAFVDGVRPPDGVHHSVAGGKHEAALAPDGQLDRADRRPWVVGTRDELLELPRDAIAPRVADEAAAPLEVDGSSRLVAAVVHEDDGRCKHGRADKRRGEKQEGGPEPRAALVFVLLPYLIWNVALPVVWFPAMSVASQRNSVVVVTTNDWPGSRGPVESHSVDVLLGFEPSVV